MTCTNIEEFKEYLKNTYEGSIIRFKTLRKIEWDINMFEEKTGIKLKYTIKDNIIYIVNKNPKIYLDSVELVDCLDLSLKSKNKFGYDVIVYRDETFTYSTNQNIYHNITHIYKDNIDTNEIIILKSDIHEKTCSIFLEKISEMYILDGNMLKY